MTHVVLYGDHKPKKSHERDQTARIKEWLTKGHKPDKELMEAIRREFLAFQVWRQQLIAEMHAAAQLLQQKRHHESMDLPNLPTAAYSHGYGLGRYEGYKEAGEMLSDIINRAGLGDGTAD